MGQFLVFIYQCLVLSVTKEWDVISCIKTYFLLKYLCFYNTFITVISFFYSYSWTLTPLSPQDLQSQLEPSEFRSTQKCFSEYLYWNINCHKKCKYAIMQHLKSCMLLKYKGRNNVYYLFVYIYLLLEWRSHLRFTWSMIWYW